jgi:queuine/archaeosine tRNA-ribosyltransferase
LLNYYTDLGFDFGVSADHLLFGAPDEEGQQRRYDITVRNAESFIEGWKARKPNWTPVGALQGMNPKQYAEAAVKYVQWGYTYLGIGGQVRSKTPYILEIARAIRSVVPRDQARIHLFGVARLDSVNQFIAAGIDSVDSASYLRQAWMRMGQNYIGKDGLYAAIRVPEVERRIRQGVSGEEADRLRQLEAEALASLRALDANQCSVDACLNAVLDYKTAIGTKFPTSVVPEYQATLKDRPWEDCACEICRDARIEVLIFRRNNRNRRRGFHNNYMFYQLMEKTIASGRMDYNWRSVKTTNQLQLPTFDE